MATATFYYPELTEQDTEVVLSELESAHALKSRRLRQGSALQLINGKGLMAQAIIVLDDKEAVKVAIDRCLKLPRPSSVSIATAIPKGDRQRTMVEMLSQLGVKQIFPLNCEHSVTRFKSTMKSKWQRWAIEACKQSQNPWLPEIISDVSIDELLAMPHRQIVYADAQGQPLTSLPKSHSELLIVVGPEGGFSEAEQLLMRNKNCTSVNLGQTILRTELAGVAAVAQSFMKDN